MAFRGCAGPGSEKGNSRGGLTNAEIAAKLHVSARTVGTHLANIYGRIGAKNRVDLTREVVAWNLKETEMKG